MTWCIITGAVSKDQDFHVNLLNLVHLIYNTLSQIGKNVIKIYEDLPSQIPAACDDHAALENWSTKINNVLGELKNDCCFIRVNMHQLF